MGTNCIERLESRMLLSVALRTQMFNINGVSTPVGVLDIVGSAYNDIVGIWVNGSNQLVVTENGKDYKFGRWAAGRVYWEGKEGNDRIEVSPELKLRLDAQGGPGNDTIIGSQAHDFLCGGKGDDYIVGGIGRDTIRGGDGNDRLFGGDDKDLIYGAGGNDTIDSGAGNDIVDGGTGTNEIDPPTLKPMNEGSYQPLAFLPNVTGYDPNQIRHAYGFSALEDQSATRGQGQTIYIVDAFAGASTYADLVAYSQQFDLPVPVNGVDFKIVNAGGRTPARDAGWAAEINLDLQWAHAIAPAAKLVLVQADSNITPDVLKAIKVAANMANAEGGGVISMSFGVANFVPTVMPDLPLWEATFQSNSKVTFLASSGDGLLTYPAMSPFVTSVGGTTLQLNSNGSVNEETAWRFGGAGLSDPQFTQPPYQRDVLPGFTVRGNPDVAYNSDPLTPYAVFLGTAFGGNTGWFALGGTSAAAPQWAAIVAMANQKRKALGKNILGADFNGTLYDLNSQKLLVREDDPTASTMTDIIAGTALGFNAGVGYDLATGLGTPRGDLLVNQLALFQPFYIQSAFQFSATYLAAPDTPTDPDIQPRHSILSGQPRAGHGFMSGSDVLELKFTTDKFNIFFDPDHISAADRYYDTEPGQESSISVRLYRTGRGVGEDRRIYGIGQADVVNYDPALSAGIPVPAIFVLKFEGSWWYGTDGQVHFHVDFAAVDPVTREPILSNPFELRYDGNSASFGGYFSGKLDG